MSEVELHKKGCSERPKARLQKRIGVAHLWPRQRKVHSEANRSVVDRLQWVDLDPQTTWVAKFHTNHSRWAKPVVLSFVSHSLGTKLLLVEVDVGANRVWSSCWSALTKKGSANTRVCVQSNLSNTGSFTDLKCLCHL